MKTEEQLMMEMTFVAVIMLIVFTATAVTAIWGLWIWHRHRNKALDVMKAYAERGEQPPTQLFDMLMASPPRRSHGANAIFFFILAVGASGFAWWGMSRAGESGGLVTQAIGLAVVFIGVAAAEMYRAIDASRNG